MFQVPFAIRQAGVRKEMGGGLADSGFYDCCFFCRWEVYYAPSYMDSERHICIAFPVLLVVKFLSCDCVHYDKFFY